jgi:hypothetical protein
MHAACELAIRHLSDALVRGGQSSSFQHMSDLPDDPHAEVSRATTRGEAGSSVSWPLESEAQNARPTEPIRTPINIWAIARGGQLYEKWWYVIEGTSRKAKRMPRPRKRKWRSP